MQRIKQLHCKSAYHLFYKSGSLILKSNLFVKVSLEEKLAKGETYPLLNNLITMWINLCLLRGSLVPFYVFFKNCTNLIYRVRF